MIVLGLVLSISAFAIDGGQSPILYWGILPGLPFILLGIASLVFKQPFSIYPFMGAAIGSFLAVSLPYGLLFYSSATYTGGGANIGLGLLLLVLPIYLILFTIVGWYIGKYKAKKT